MTANNSAPDIIETSLCACNGLGQSESAKQLLKILRENGCEFLDRARAGLDPHPETRIKSTGSIIVPLHFRHRLLGLEFFAVARGLPYGSGGLAYLSKTRSFAMHQGVAAEANNLNELANGQLSLARQVYPHLRPVYGWIDEFGENAVDRAFSSITQLRFVFWANIFGPTLVKQLGKTFLSTCPAHRVAWLDDGGAIVVSSETYSKWYSDPPRQLAEYLSQKVAAIEFYRSEGVQLPGEMTFHLGDGDE